MFTLNTLFHAGSTAKCCQWQSFILILCEWHLQMHICFYTHKKITLIVQFMWEIWSICLLSWADIQLHEFCLIRVELTYDVVVSVQCENTFTCGCCRIWWWATGWMMSKWWSCLWRSICRNAQWGCHSWSTRIGLTFVYTFSCTCNALGCDSLIATIIAT